jgi:hypothetical protein
MKFNIEAKIFPDFSSFESMLKQWKADKKRLFTQMVVLISTTRHIDTLLKDGRMGTKLVWLNPINSVTLLKAGTSVFGC